VENQTYQIKVHSCRKDTTIFLKLTDDQAWLLKEVARRTQEVSKSECEPTIHVSKVTKITSRGAEEQNV